MSEYNADIQYDDCCDESVKDEDSDDIFDDLLNLDDCEV